MRLRPFTLFLLLGDPLGVDSASHLSVRSSNVGETPSVPPSSIGFPTHTPEPAFAQLGASGANTSAPANVSADGSSPSLAGNGSSAQSVSSSWLRTSVSSGPGATASLEAALSSNDSASRESLSSFGAALNSNSGVSRASVSSFEAASSSNASVMRESASRASVSSFQAALSSNASVSRAPVTSFKDSLSSTAGASLASVPSFEVTLSSNASVSLEAASRSSRSSFEAALSSNASLSSASESLLGAALSSNASALPSFSFEPVLSNSASASRAPGTSLQSALSRTRTSSRAYSSSSIGPTSRRTLTTLPSLSSVVRSTRRLSSVVLPKSSSGAGPLLASNNTLISSTILPSSFLVVLNSNSNGTGNGPASTPSASPSLSPSRHTLRVNSQASGASPSFLASSLVSAQSSNITAPFTSALGPPSNETASYLATTASISNATTPSALERVSTSGNVSIVRLSSSLLLTANSTGLVPFNSSRFVSNSRGSGSTVLAITASSTNSISLTSSFASELSNNSGLSNTELSSPSLLRTNSTGSTPSIATGLNNDSNHTNTSLPSAGVSSKNPTSSVSSVTTIFSSYLRGSSAGFSTTSILGANATAISTSIVPRFNGSRSGGGQLNTPVLSTNSNGSTESVATLKGPESKSLSTQYLNSGGNETLVTAASPTLTVNSTSLGFVSALSSTPSTALNGQTSLLSTLSNVTSNRASLVSNISALFSSLSLTSSLSLSHNSSSVTTLASSLESSELNQSATTLETSAFRKESIVSTAAIQSRSTGGVSIGSGVATATNSLTFGEVTTESSSNVTSLSRRSQSALASNATGSFTLGSMLSSTSATGSLQENLTSSAAGALSESTRPISGSVGPLATSSLSRALSSTSTSANSSKEAPGSSSGSISASVNTGIGSSNASGPPRSPSTYIRTTSATSLSGPANGTAAMSSSSGQDISTSFTVPSVASNATDGTSVTHTVDITQNTVPLSDTSSRISLSDSASNQRGTPQSSISNNSSVSLKTVGPRTTSVTDTSTESPQSIVSATSPLSSGPSLNATGEISTTASESSEITSILNSNVLNATGNSFTRSGVSSSSEALSILDATRSLRNVASSVPAAVKTSSQLGFKLPTSGLFVTTSQSSEEALSGSQSVSVENRASSPSISSSISPLSSSILNSGFIASGPPTRLQVSSTGGSLTFSRSTAISQTSILPIAGGFQSTHGNSSQTSSFVGVSAAVNSTTLSSAIATANGTSQFSAIPSSNQEPSSSGQPNSETRGAVISTPNGNGDHGTTGSIIFLSSHTSQSRLSTFLVAETTTALPSENSRASSLTDNGQGANNSAGPLPFSDNTDASGLTEYLTFSNSEFTTTGYVVVPTEGTASTHLLTEPLTVGTFTTKVVYTVTVPGAGGTTNDTGSVISNGVPQSRGSQSKETQGLESQPTGAQGSSQRQSGSRVPSQPLVTTSETTGTQTGTAPTALSTTPGFTSSTGVNSSTVTTTVTVPCTHMTCRAATTTTVEFTTVCTFTFSVPTGTECASATTIVSTVVVSENSQVISLPVTHPCSTGTGTITGQGSAGTASPTESSTPSGNNGAIQTEQKSSVPATPTRSASESPSFVVVTVPCHHTEICSSRGYVLSTIYPPQRPTGSSTPCVSTTVLTTINGMSTVTFTTSVACGTKVSGPSVSTGLSTFETRGTSVAINPSESSSSRSENSTGANSRPQSSSPVHVKSTPQTGTTLLTTSETQASGASAEITTANVVPRSSGASESATQTQNAQATGSSNNEFSSVRGTETRSVQIPAVTSTELSSPGNSIETPSKRTIATQNSNSVVPSGGPSQRSIESQSEAALSPTLVKSTSETAGSPSTSAGPVTTINWHGQSSEFSILPSSTNGETASTTVSTSQNTVSSSVASQSHSIITTAVTIPCTHGSCQNAETTSIFTTTCSFTVPALSSGECTTFTDITSDVTVSGNSRQITVGANIPCTAASVVGSGLVIPTGTSSGKTEQTSLPSSLEQSSYQSGLHPPNNQPSVSQPLRTGSNRANTELLTSNAPNTSPEAVGQTGTESLSGLLSTSQQNLGTSKVSRQEQSSRFGTANTNSAPSTLSSVGETTTTSMPNFDFTATSNTGLSSSENFSTLAETPQQPGESSKGPATESQKIASGQVRGSTMLANAPSGPSIGSRSAGAPVSTSVTPYSQSVISTTVTVPCTRSSCQNAETTTIYTTVCSFTVPVPSSGGCSVSTDITSDVTISGNSRQITVTANVPCTSTSSVGTSPVNSEIPTESGPSHTPESATPNSGATSPTIFPSLEVATETSQPKNRSSQTAGSGSSPANMGTPAGVPTQPGNGGLQSVGTLPADTGTSASSMQQSLANYPPSSITETPSFVVISVPCQHTEICSSRGYLLSTIFPVQSETGISNPCAVQTVLTTLRGSETVTVTTTLACGQASGTGPKVTPTEPINSGSQFSLSLPGPSNVAPSQRSSITNIVGSRSNESPSSEAAPGITKTTSSVSNAQGISTGFTPTGSLRTALSSTIATTVSIPCTNGICTQTVYTTVCSFTLPVPTGGECSTLGTTVSVVTVSSNSKTVTVTANMPCTASSAPYIPQHGGISAKSSTSRLSGTSTVAGTRSGQSNSTSIASPEAGVATTSSNTEKQPQIQTSSTITTHSAPGNTTRMTSAGGISSSTTPTVSRSGTISQKVSATGLSVPTSSTLTSGLSSTIFTTISVPCTSGVCPNTVFTTVCSFTVPVAASGECSTASVLVSTISMSGNSQAVTVTANIPCNAPLATGFQTVPIATGLSPASKLEAYTQSTSTYSEKTEQPPGPAASSRSELSPSSSLPSASTARAANTLSNTLSTVSQLGTTSHLVSSMTSTGTPEILMTASLGVSVNTSQVTPVTSESVSTGASPNVPSRTVAALPLSGAALTSAPVTPSGASSGSPQASILPKILSTVSFNSQSKSQSYSLPGSVSENVTPSILTTPLAIGSQLSLPLTSISSGLSNSLIPTTPLSGTVLPPGSVLLTTVSAPCTNEASCTATVYTTICSFSVPPTTAPNQCVSESTVVSVVTVGESLVKTISVPVSIPCGSSMSTAESILATPGASSPVGSTGRTEQPETSSFSQPGRTTEITSRSSPPSSNVVAQSGGTPVQSNSGITLSTSSASSIPATTAYGSLLSSGTVTGPESNEETAVSSTILQSFGLPPGKSHVQGTQSTGVSTPGAPVTLGSPGESSRSGAQSSKVSIAAPTQSGSTSLEVQASSSQTSPKPPSSVSPSGSNVSSILVETSSPINLVTPGAPNSLAVPQKSSIAASSGVPNSPEESIPGAHTTETSGPFASISQTTTLGTPYTSANTPEVFSSPEAPSLRTPHTGARSHSRSTEVSSSGASTVKPTPPGVFGPLQTTIKSSPSSPVSLTTQNAASLIASQISGVPSLETHSSQGLGAPTSSEVPGSPSISPHETSSLETLSTGTSTLAASTLIAESSLHSRSQASPTGQTAVPPGSTLVTTVSAPCTHESCKSTVYTTVCSVTVPPTTAQNQCVSESAIVSVVTVGDSVVQTISVPISIPCGSTIPTVGPSQAFGTPSSSTSGSTSEESSTFSTPGLSPAVSVTSRAPSASTSSAPFQVPSAPSLSGASSEGTSSSEGSSLSSSSAPEAPVSVPLTTSGVFSVPATQASSPGASHVPGMLSSKSAASGLTSTETSAPRVPSAPGGPSSGTPGTPSPAPSSATETNALSQPVSSATSESSTKAPESPSLSSGQLAPGSSPLGSLSGPAIVTATSGATLIGSVTSTLTQQGPTTSSRKLSTVPRGELTGQVVTVSTLLPTTSCPTSLLTYMVIHSSSTLLEGPSAGPSSVPSAVPEEATVNSEYLIPGTTQATLPLSTPPPQKPETSVPGSPAPVVVLATGSTPAAAEESPGRSTGSESVGPSGSGRAPNVNAAKRAAPQLSVFSFIAFFVMIIL